MAGDRYPVRRGAPKERAESHIDRRSGLVDPPHERRKRRNLELAPQIITPAADVATIAGAHDHSGVYSPVGHTHTSGSITDFTEAAQDVIGALLVDSSTLDFTYNDAGNAETVAVIANSSVQKVAARKNSTGGDVGTRRRINFIEGTNVTLTLADDGVDDELDLTIAAALTAGSAGLDLISVLTITAVTTASFPANVFSATYENYFLELDLPSQATAQLMLRLRAAGVDAAGAATYGWAQNAPNTGATTAALGGTATGLMLNSNAANARTDTAFDVWIKRPNITALTVFTYLGIVNFTGVNQTAFAGGGLHAVATAYDSLSIVSGGSMTGTARLYGLRNS